MQHTSNTDNISMVLACLQVLVAINKVGEGDGNPELVRVGVWTGHLLCLNSLAAQFEILLGETTGPSYTGRAELVKFYFSHLDQSALLHPSSQLEPPESAT